MVHYTLTSSDIGPLSVSSPQEEGPVAEALSKIYQQQAELYPNPRLAEERLRRDELLREIRQELLEKQKDKERASGQEDKSRQGSGGGSFFGFLFGKSKGSKVSPDPLLDIREEDYLIFKDIHSDDDARSSSLCGTQAVLDLGCIPSEAHALARFYLSSAPLPGCENLLIPEIGLVSELVGDSWLKMCTSDKDELEKAASREETYFLRQARVSRIGSDCIAVSWGFSDGLVVIYRRREKLWESVALLATSAAVLENLQSTSDVFLQNDDGSLSSPMLRVTDITPLFVEMPTQQRETAVTLVVARLGGYLELVPLPFQIWAGPIPKTRRRHPKHYALGHLPNLATGDSICALTVAEHMEDLLKIKGFRTSVSVETEWDNEAFPDSPPAEYLLVASGTKLGHERLTFWAVATIFTSEKDKNSGKKNGYPFHLYVQFLEAVRIGPTGHISIFCPEGILEHWRKARHVERRASEAHDNSIQPEQKRASIATLSVSAPLVELRFQLLRRHLALSVLDGTGGVFILDCTAVLKQTQQTLTREQLESFDELVSVMVSRGDIQVGGSRAVDMEWTSSSSLAIATENNMQLLSVGEQWGIRTSSSIKIPGWVVRPKFIVRVANNVRNDENEMRDVIVLLPRKSDIFASQLIQSSPEAIVTHLINAAKYGEALRTIENFSDCTQLQKDAEICRKQLWEIGRCLEALEQISDDRYVIDEVSNLFKGRTVIMEMDLPSCRKAGRIALSRMARTRVAASGLQLSEDFEKLKVRLGQWLVRCGTYTLLCRHFGCDESTIIFLDKFASLSLHALAGDVAAKGDIKALTLILVRHHEELVGDRLSILSQIPSSIDPIAYAHLLPVYTKESSPFEYFLTGEEFQGLRLSSLLYAICEQEIGYPIFLEDEDPDVMHHSAAAFHLGRSQLADWYLEKLQKIHMSIGGLHLQLKFLDLALRSNVVDEEHFDDVIKDALFESFARRGNEMDIKNIRASLNACVGIVQASRSSLEKSERVVKSRHVIEKLALSVVEELPSLCRDKELLPTETRYLINRLWDIYECLPSRLAPHEETIDDLVRLKEKLDKLYHNLIVVDIMANWFPLKALDALPPDSTVSVSEIASAICMAFCEKVSAKGDTLSKTRLVYDLSGDLGELEKHWKGVSIDLEAAINGTLLIGLLNQGEFHVLSEVLSSKILGRHTKREQILPAVMSCVNDIVAGNNDGPSAYSSFAVIDVLGPNFPELNEAFVGVRRYLDAAHFIHTVLSPDKSELNPSTLQHMSPLDIIERVMEENPLCILHGCDDWADSSYGRIRVRDLLSFFSSQEEVHGPNEQPPSLPGGAVFRLADTLGLLISSTAHLLLQNRIVHFAQKGELPWVAAAVAITSLYTKDLKVWEDEDDIRLDTVAAVVSDATYDDVWVKARLCQAALSCLATSRSEALARIIDSFASLEHTTSRFRPENLVSPNPEVHGRHKVSPSPNSSEFLVFRAAEMLAQAAKAVTTNNSLLQRKRLSRPIDRVFRETMIVYGTDLNYLFTILQAKASIADLDDPLLLSIGRFHFFWCISDAIRVSDYDRNGTFEHADAYENLAVGASMLLHCTSIQDTLSDLRELKDILKTQSAPAIKISESSRSKTEIVRPDLGLVQKLVELGYSENGARRAAVMTNNEGQQAALIWAVAHSAEPFFDSPMVFLKPAHDPHTDITMIHSIEHCLQTLEAIVGGLKALESLVSQASPLSPQSRLQPQTTPKPKKQPPAAITKRQNQTSIRAPPPPPLPQVKQQRVAPVPPPSEPQNAAVNPLPSVPALPPSPPAAAASIGLTSSAPQSAPSFLSRTALHQAGLSFREQSRGISSRLDEEERKRLLQKGKELFKSRSPSKNSSARDTRSEQDASAPSAVEQDDGWDFEEDKEMYDNDSDGWDFDD